MINVNLEDLKFQSILDMYSSTSLNLVFLNQLYLDRHNIKTFLVAHIHSSHVCLFHQRYQ